MALPLSLARILRGLLSAIATLAVVVLIGAVRWAEMKGSTTHPRRRLHAIITRKRRTPAPEDEMEDLRRFPAERSRSSR